MSDLGKTLYVGEYSSLITRADGYAPPDGYAGYSYEFDSFPKETEKGNIVSYFFSLDKTSESLPTPPTGGGATIYYVMRGKDVDCGSVTYRTWTVSGSPDTTGSQYVGTKCGGSALTDIVVVLTYTG